MLRIAHPTFSAFLFLALSPLPALAAPQRLILDRNTPPAIKDLKGPLEIVVVPPFEGALISVKINGQQVVSNVAPPYQIELDLGSTPVEQRFEIRAVSRDQKRKTSWIQTFNQGQSFLSVALRPSAEGTILEAVVVAPAKDPIVAVELYGETGLLERKQTPPYLFSVTAASGRSFQVAARTRSGAEVTDFYSPTGMIHNAAYDVRTVPLLVSVVDDRGSIRSNLASRDFKILDNNVETRILEFARAEQDPVSVAVVLDGSASMTEMMSDVTTAAFNFVKQIARKNDRFAVFSIHDVPKREQPVTGDLELIEKAMKNIRPAGDTALYDAIASASRELSGEKSRKAIVLLSDGADTSSNATFEDAMDLARRAGVPCYVIAFGATAKPDQNRDRLNYLATETGGFLVLANKNSLASRYAEIEKDLRSKYLIKYQVSDVARPNEWRKVRIVMSSPRLSARAIRGYFAQ